MSTFVQANTNGRLHAADEPSITPLNRGFLYGDAIYEVWRTYGGVIFAWEEHWSRLECSARALHLTLPFTSAYMLEEIRRTAAAHRGVERETEELYIRLQITRGGGAIGLDTMFADKADFVLLVQENRLFTPEKLSKGLHLSFAELRRNSPQALNPAWKTGNYLNNILCLREARARGADEVVITNLAGEIAEAAVSNIAFICGGDLITPPLTAGILGGITRQVVIGHVAAMAGLGVKEQTVRPADLSSMEECCLLSTTKDVTPVASIDDRQFRIGADSATLRLKQAFADYVHAYNAKHPGLRV